MDKKDFITKLSEGNFEWQETDKGVIVRNLNFDTETLFYPAAIEKWDWNTLEIASHQAKNIQGITRVSGYFSIVEKWNPGKRSELVDRHRVDGKREI